MWSWLKKSLLKGYVSELDRFLHEFDNRPEAHSPSRRAEEAKYARINKLRDDTNAKVSLAQIWEDSNLKSDFKSD